MGLVENLLNLHKKRPMTLWTQFFQYLPLYVYIPFLFLVIQVKHKMTKYLDKS